MILSLIFVILAALFLVAAYVWMVIAAFRVDLPWGLLVVFVPIIMPLMFLLVHWEAARKPFFCGLAGLVALVPAVAMNWETIQQRKAQLFAEVLVAHGQTPPKTDKELSAAVLAKKQATLIEHANQMNAKYADLIARRKTLATSDEATKAAFAADAEAYAALRKQVAAEQAEVEAMRASDQ
jgi:hypothetical protein